MDTVFIGVGGVLLRKLRRDFIFPYTPRAQRVYIYTRIRSLSRRAD